LTKFLHEAATTRHSRAGGNPALAGASTNENLRPYIFWIPACARMTEGTRPRSLVDDFLAAASLLPGKFFRQTVGPCAGGFDRRDESPRAGIEAEWHPVAGGPGTELRAGLGFELQPVVAGRIVDPGVGEDSFVL